MTIDKLCDEFERQLKDGHQPSIDNYLCQVPEIDRLQVFRELLLVQLSYVPASQHTDLMERYMMRYPQYADLLCRMWVAKPVERTVAHPGAEPILCPHCRASIAVVSAVAQSPATISRPDIDEAVSPAATTARFLHHYRLLNEIGQGTFGTVHRAFDTKLGRMVAIKIPRHGQFTDSEEEIRFLREARSAGQLDHPGIVKVLDAGICRDTHFIVSDYFAGTSLADRIRAEPLTTREAATLVWQVAEALEHAHTRQIIHRDLKTANILVDEQGRPKLTDFGLARHDSAEVSLTADGKVLGTPGYMSPEQAEGGSHYVDRRSDIYSLGVVLFELLTGERPFRGTAAAVLQQAIHDDPPAPSSLVPSINRDLDTICLKCLQKAPPARYSTARELAQDLRCWLDGRPVAARPVGQWGRLLRWSGRHKLVSLLALLVGLLITTTCGSLAWAMLHARQANQQLLSTYLETLSTASPDLVPSIRDVLKPYHSSLPPLVEQKLQSSDLSDGERQRLRSLLDDLSADGEQTSDSDNR